RRVVLPSAPPNLKAEWQTTAPVIQDGKVVFTAPDEASIHCVDLRDGRPLWKVDRNDGDLYLAGVARGKVLIVGRQHCQALGLNDGKLAWQAETGLPAGRGVLVGGSYWLPLKAAGGAPAVWALDVDQGAVRARIVTPDKEAPGDL